MKRSFVGTDSMEALCRHVTPRGSWERRLISKQSCDPVISRLNAFAECLTSMRNGVPYATCVLTGATAKSWRVPASLLICYEPPRKLPESTYEPRWPG